MPGSLEGQYSDLKLATVSRTERNLTISFREERYTLTQLDITEKYNSYAEFLRSCLYEISSLATRGTPAEVTCNFQSSRVSLAHWKIDNAVAKHVVEAFYESTFKQLDDSVVMDFTKVTQTLERATCSEKKTGLEQRIGFIHIGV
ncbi:uncharacterized protein BJ212DRAFT_1298979 [Suillus subaureus]|uniref:Uncharacterized protein n=1 Tax=Suillus subaureus TaxID=48587 RepID=A0A9P7EDH9_9AGAM|nr:uncharacterized protein BJ212DRAFT_1298979 [Suillus subaureus]KAG1818143.1 hypothetical protein BJ212DRAFT_1298979 [Suillus subaureus]